MKSSYFSVPILNIVIWPTKEDEGMGDFIVVLKCMHVCPVFFDCILITYYPKVWFERRWNTVFHSIMIWMNSSYFSVPIPNIVIWPKEDEGMGDFIVVLKCMHVCPVFFDCIVLTNYPTVWFERRWNTVFHSIMIWMNSSYFYEPIPNIVIWPKEDEGMGDFIVVPKCKHVRPILFDCIVLTKYPMVWSER